MRTRSLPGKAPEEVDVDVDVPLIVPGTAAMKGESLERKTLNSSLSQTAGMAIKH